MMDDQFGGRTDDDLFFDDDFEPVDGVATIVHQDVPVEISSRYITHSDLVPHPADIESALAPLAAAAAAATKKKARRRRKDKSPKQPPPPPPPRGGLAQSRFADKPTEKPPQVQQPQSRSEPPSPNPTPATASHDQTSGDVSSSTPAANPPTATGAHRERRNNNGRNQGKPAESPSATVAASTDARAQSGANPRQKLTEEELTAKLEKMKVLSAEKARKFEKAEKDEKQHAEAYARGMEEARRQRAENAERRRQNEEQRRRLEEERTKNRERKLKAINMNKGGGGWDEGKEAILAEEEASRRRPPARGVNGGVRGTKGGSGLRSSRFAARDSSEGEKVGTPDRTTDTEKSLDEQRPRRGGGRGRGGNRGGGRAAQGGGRGGGRASVGNENGPSTSSAAATPTRDDFPSLPAKPPTSQEEQQPANAAATAPPSKPAVLAPLPRFAPAIGKWDDEMEFMEEQNAIASKK
ncbi:hypothetical protein ISF_03483 [Cordyceps fumosorosea ARSEF 2679]|uniref:Uncharacterized protein n=1 Tax=Cordyceps fumosorosea (strain ARSEF 2679) TaxID=1081104 RepID=A0A168ART3_CORFA|nr:hypothetical protein ISF_03483 [Cordyceps fumosorosea ARSEF 2679]OAA69108.1 hypothetical protein ISF_03483 [Cordyceps fumosorosea ARSEF 2679]